MTESEALHSRDHLVQFDSVINTPKVNSMSLNNLSSKFDLSSLPAATLLRMLDNDKSESQPRFDSSYHPEVSSSSVGRYLGLHYERPLSPGGIRETTVPLSSSKFTADLEALDWTLKGDLLELKRSYSMTVDHQMGEIERLSEQLEQTERQLRSRKSEFESLSLRSQAKVDSLQQQVDELTAQLGAVTANSDAKDHEISNLSRSLEASDNRCSQLAEQLRHLKAEMDKRERNHMVTVESINCKIDEMNSQHQQESEKLKKLHAEKLEYEVEKVQRSLRESHESEARRGERSFETTKEKLEQTIAELSARITRDSAEHRSAIEKLKDDHERSLCFALTREKDRAQAELHDLQRSLSNKNEYEVDSLRRKLANQNQDTEEKKRRVENEVELLKSREKGLNDEIDMLKKRHREELESLKSKLESQHASESQKLEEKMKRKLEAEIEKERADKKVVEQNLQVSETKLADIKTKFVSLEEQLQKLEQRTINSIEKTSVKLVKALGVSDPRTDRSQTVSSALEFLRWTAKETINMISTNQTLVLDICDKWKKFEREKNGEVKRLREQFDQETDGLIEFSKQEIGQSYRHNMRQFTPIPDS